MPVPTAIIVQLFFWHLLLSRVHYYESRELQENSVGEQAVTGLPHPSNCQWRAIPALALNNIIMTLYFDTHSYYYYGISGSYFLLFNIFLTANVSRKFYDQGPLLFIIYLHQASDRRYGLRGPL
jgi:hypothetical protein